MSQPGTTGRLRQVIDRWVYTACLCFGLDLDEQQRSGFVYDYSVYQVEYTDTHPRVLHNAPDPSVSKHLLTAAGTTLLVLSVSWTTPASGGRLRSGLSRGVRLFREQAVAVHDRGGEVDEFAVVDA